MRVAWFDAFSGVSGDMMLGALLAAGWDPASLAGLPRRLGLEGVEISVRPVRKGAFAATQVDVRAAERQPHRHLHHVTAILEAADLPGEVRDRAIAVFRRLAAAEARVHGTTIEKVHFHEVGAADAIVDIAGVVLGLHELGVKQVYGSPLPLGGGFVDSDHGRIPIPAPATALLLEGVPVVSTPIRAELVTPTGAALLTTLAVDWGPPAAFRMGPVGLGAGARDLDEQPNVLRLVLGEVESGASGSTVTVLESALDDESPQVLADLLPRLLDAGALDAMIAPVLMKKGRPGHWLVVLAPPDRAETLANLVLAHTSTLGVRTRRERRIEAARTFEDVETPFGVIRMKVAELPGGSKKAFPEFESVKTAADASGRPVREVAEAARAAWTSGPPANSPSRSKKTD